MKRKIAALLMGTTLSVAVCGYSVQAMTYGYDMGGKVFISEDSSSSNLTEEEKERIRDIRFTITFGTDEVEIKPQMQDIEAVEPFVVTDMNFEREAAE